MPTGQAGPLGVSTATDGTNSIGAFTVTTDAAGKARRECEEIFVFRRYLTAR
jgi:hypothetical protein